MFWFSSLVSYPVATLKLANMIYIIGNPAEPRLTDILNKKFNIIAKKEEARKERAQHFSTKKTYFSRSGFRISILSFYQRIQKPCYFVRDLETSPLLSAISSERFISTRDVKTSTIVGIK